MSLPRVLHLFGPPGSDAPLDIHLAHTCMSDTHRNSSSHACAQQHSGRWSVPSVAENGKPAPWVYSLQNVKPKTQVWLSTPDFKDPAFDKHLPNASRGVLKHGAGPQRRAYAGITTFS